MTKRGHSVDIIAGRSDKGPTFLEQRPEAQVHRLRSHSVPTHETWRICLPWEIKRDIKRIFDEVQPDVVHIQCHYMIGQATIAEAVRRGIRTIATNHFMPENLEPFLPFPQWFSEHRGQEFMARHGQDHGQGGRRHDADTAGRQGDA